MKRLLQLTLAFTFAAFSAGCDSNDPIAGDAGIVSVDEVRFNPLTADLSDDELVVSQQYTVPAIDLDVVEHGAVLAYFRVQNTWTAMPYTYGVDDDDQIDVNYSVTIGYAFEHRLLEVFYEVSAPEADPLTLPATDIKVVVLQNLAASKNGIDLRNYEEVARYYGLED